MKYLDFFYDIQKEWATEKEVSKICSCSRSDADLILQELEYEAQSRNIKTFKQNNQIYIPMSLFLEYIGDAKVDRINRYHQSLIEFYTY